MEPFDDEWRAAALEALDVLPAVEGLSVVVDYVVAGGLAPGGPKGKTVVGVTVEDGRVVSLNLGRSDDPDVVISLDGGVARQILRGELSGDAAYMNGSLKVEGAHRRWLLDLRPVRDGPVDALADLVARTTG